MFVKDFILWILVINLTKVAIQLLIVVILRIA